MSFTRFEPAQTRLQRSTLAVPGSQPQMFGKALESDADTVFLDLEDAVAPADKEQARLNVIASLLEHDWRAAGKTIMVRVNGIDTHYFYRDVVDVIEQAGHRLDLVLIPEGGRRRGCLPHRCAADADRDRQGHFPSHRPGSPDRDLARHGERRGHCAVEQAPRGDAFRRGRLCGQCPRAHREHRRPQSRLSR